MKPPVPLLSVLTIDGETIDLDYLLNAPYEDVSEAAEKLPGAISWMNDKRADAYEQLALATRKHKEEQARQYFELREGGFEERGLGGKVTETALKMAVMLEPSVIAAATIMESWDARLMRVTGQIEAVQAKLDLVRTSEATRRRLQMPHPTTDDLLDASRETNNNDEEQS